jgi:hypothetical protein
MAVTVVTRWTTPNADASTKIAKEAKAVWMKAGAQDARLAQVYTGEYTGQWLFSVVFADFSAYAKAASTVPNGEAMKKLQAANSKVGAAMHERWILMGAEI